MNDASEIVDRYIGCAGKLDAGGLAACSTPGASLNGYLGPTEINGPIELLFADVERMAAA